MSLRKLTARSGFRLWLGLSIALAALGLASPRPPAVQAAPAAVPQTTGGVFTITSLADDNSTSDGLTLREALLLVRGGTGPAGLNRALTAGEQAALAGCTISSGQITGICGVGFANSLVFTGSLGLHPVITLTAALPAITNTAPTTLDGSVNGVFPIVAAAGLLTNTDALLISSNNNTLAGLTITGAPRDDLHLTGRQNQLLTGTVLLAASRYGLLVDGGISNTIDSALVGTPSAGAGACAQGNGQGGIVLTNGALSNTIQFATIACNTGAGIRLDGASTGWNSVFTTTLRAQTGDGVVLLNGTSYNTLAGDTIIANSLDGVRLTGAATTYNRLVQPTSYIGVTPSGAAAGNGQYGVQASAGAYSNGLDRSIISGNGLGGLRLDSGANNNFVTGDVIGLDPTGTNAVPNLGPGVEVDNAPNSAIGLADEPNYIAGNQGPGIRFTNTLSDAVNFGNWVGTATLGNGGPGIELVNTSDTAVRALIVQNNTGPGIVIEGDASTGNLIAPLVLSNNSGVPIDLGNDGITYNGAHTPPGPNHWLNYPVVTAVSGQMITGTVCLSCTVLIYWVTSGAPGAPGSSADEISSAVADAAGRWHATLPAGLPRASVALQACTAPCSDPYILSPNNSDTSELSPLLSLWLPLVRR